MSPRSRSCQQQQPKKRGQVVLFGFALVANITCTALVSRERGSRKANTIRIMATINNKNRRLKKKHETVMQ